MTQVDIMQPMPDKYRDTEDIVFQKLNQRQRFRLRNIAEEQRCHDQRIPYCFRAAKRDFIEEQQRLFKKYGGTTEEDVEVKDFDLSKYSELKNFKLLKKSKVQEKKLLDGMKVDVVTGHWYDYQWKDGGYKISVEMPAYLEKKK